MFLKEQRTCHDAALGPESCVLSPPTRVPSPPANRKSLVRRAPWGSDPPKTRLGGVVGDMGAASPPRHLLSIFVDRIRRLAWSSCRW